VIQAILGRPTRSGRVPRPAVHPSHDNFDLLTDIAYPVKSSASDTGAVSSQSDLPISLPASKSLSTEAAAIQRSKPVATLPQPVRSRSRPKTSLTRSSAVAIPHTTPATSTGSAVVSASPQIDLSHLPPGYFVVVEVPSSTSSSDASGSQQQALYHIFAVDQGAAAESSTSSPAVGVATEQPYSSATSAMHQPQSGTLNSSDAVLQSAVRNRSFVVTHPADVRNGGSLVQVARPSAVRNRSVQMATAGAPQHTDRSVLPGRPTSSSRDVTEICHDLSGLASLANCELTATKQEDGTLVIQTTPATNRLPPPPTQMVPQPTTTLLAPRQTSVKLVPRFPSVQVVARPPCAQTVTCGEPEIVLDTNCGKLSDATGEEDEDDGGGAQYVDIVVEDYDNFEREEYIV